MSCEASMKNEKNCRARVSEKPDSEKSIDLTHDLNDLDAEQRLARKEALCNMLKANEARQQAIKSKRLPCMAMGETIIVVSGKFAGKKDVILDADFITGKVQLEIDNVDEPQWFAFSNVGGCA